MKLSFSLLLFFLIITTKVMAAPCCTGSSAAPALLLGDDKMQLTLGASQSSVIGDAGDSSPPVFRDDSGGDVTQTYELDGAYLLSDRFQAGFSLPILNHSLSTDSSTVSATNIGDVRVVGAYEFLPEWSYSTWRPKAYGFIQTTIPLGTSVYDSTTEGNVDASSKGFYAFSLGSVFLKHGAKWDSFFIPEVHYSLSRTFSQNPGGDLYVTPGFGASASLGAGVSPGGRAFRVGLRLQPVYEQSKTLVAPTGTTQSGVQLIWDSELDLSYLINLDWTITGSYTDQTLMGPVYNSTLNRIFALAVQRRWER